MMKPTAATRCPRRPSKFRLGDKLLFIQSGSPRSSTDDLRVVAVAQSSSLTTDYVLISPADLRAALGVHHLAATLEELYPLEPHTCPGPSREDWSTAYLFYVATGLTSVRKFYADWRRIVFPLCGFQDRIPPYVEMATRFAELKADSEWFTEAFAQLVANAQVPK